MLSHTSSSEPVQYLRELAPAQLSQTTSPPPATPKPCPGYNLDIPDGCSPYATYPFGLHAQQMLPWDISISSCGTVYLRSRTCTEAGVPSSSNMDDTRPCRNCAQLESNSTLASIVDRMRNGIHENTPHRYLPFASLGDLLQRKNTQIDRLRFENLNMTRTLLSRARTIDGHKRFVRAVASSDVHSRVHKVVSVARSNSMSVHAIVARIDQANARVYSSRTYDEIDYQRAYLLWKLGGQRAADLGSRALGLPSLSATRRKFTSSPIIASATFPTVEEMVENLKIVLPLSCLTDLNAAFAIEVDELKTEKRFRWDPYTNMILGVCREHGHLCSLEFRSVDEVRALGEKLCTQEVHAATEVSHGCSVGSCLAN